MPVTSIGFVDVESYVGEGTDILPVLPCIKMVDN